MSDHLLPQRLTDCQARNVILAAESRGFRREPGLHARAYDQQLHDDAIDVYAFLTATTPEALRDALSRAEPIPADEAARRIMASGRVTFATVTIVLELAASRGFDPPVSDLPIRDDIRRWEQATAAVAFLWDTGFRALEDALGDAARLAPTPDDAWVPCPTCGR
jgi:hypothetical protein